MIRAFAVATGLTVVVAGEAYAAEKAIPLPDPKHGNAVDVSGRLSVLGEVAPLDAVSPAGKTILVDLGALNGQQRAMITAKCSPVYDVHVTGRGGPVLRSRGVAATDLAVVEQGAPPELASE